MSNETATLAGGCFWCTEAVFNRLKGVVKVVSGYSGGDQTADGKVPSYGKVSMGTTGYAEAIQITFNSDIISYKTLLDVFWKLHDPTTLNRQGGDIGTQYRSVIFYHDATQKKIAQESKEAVEASGLYKDAVVTHIEPFTSFYKAEDYHQEYYDTNSTNPYCRIVIDPKITKLYKEFNSIIKPSSDEI